MKKLFKEDKIKVDNKEIKVKDLTIKEIEDLYFKNKISTLVKFITDDNYYIILDKEI